jgi:hypothetical protein
MSAVFKSQKISQDGEVCQQLISSLVRVPLQKLNNNKVLNFMLTLMEEAVAAFGKGCLPETLKETIINIVYIATIRKSLLCASNVQQFGRVCTGRLPLVQSLSLESSSSRNGTIGYDLGFACLTCTKQNQQ